jgi:hypothetical protein
MKAAILNIVEKKPFKQQDLVTLFTNPELNRDQMHIAKEDLKKYQLNEKVYHGLHVYQYLLDVSPVDAIQAMLTSIDLLSEGSQLLYDSFKNSLITAQAIEPHEDKNRGLIFSLIFLLLSKPKSDKLYKSTYQFINLPMVTLAHCEEAIQHVSSILNEDDTHYTQKHKQTLNQIKHQFTVIKQEHPILRGNSESPSSSTSTTPAPSPSTSPELPKTTSQKKTVKKNNFKTPQEIFRIPDTTFNKQGKIIWYEIKTTTSGGIKKAPGITNGDQPLDESHWQSWYWPLTSKLDDSRKVNSTLYRALSRCLKETKSPKQLRARLNKYCIPHNSNHALKWGIIQHRTPLLHSLLDEYPHSCIYRDNGLPDDLKKLLYSQYPCKRDVLDEPNLLGYTALQTAAMRADLAWYAHLWNMDANPKTNTDTTTPFQARTSKNLDTLELNTIAKKDQHKAQHLLKGRIKFACQYELESRHPQSSFSYKNGNYKRVPKSKQRQFFPATQLSSVIMLLRAVSNIELSDHEICTLTNIMVAVLEQPRYENIVAAHIGCLDAHSLRIRKQLIRQGQSGQSCETSRALLKILTERAFTTHIAQPLINASKASKASNKRKRKNTTRQPGLFNSNLHKKAKKTLSRKFPPFPTQQEEKVYSAFPPTRQ